MAGANSKARVGGARSTNGKIAGFVLDDCPVKASAYELDVSDYTQVYVLAESIDRRLIFQANDTNIATNLAGATSLLLKSGESIPLDVSGMTNNLYIATDSASLTSNAIRLVLFDES